MNESDFVNAMQDKWKDEYTPQGLKCLYRYLSENYPNDTDVFCLEWCHAEYTEYRGLLDFNTKNHTRYRAIEFVPCFIQFPDLDGFFQN